MVKKRVYNRKAKKSFNSTQLDAYIKKQHNKLTSYERIRMNDSLGIFYKDSDLAKRTLDQKLQILSYMNKKYMLIIMDNEEQDLKDVRKVFRHYISEEANYESDEARKRLNTFIIDDKDISKRYFAGTQRFSTELYLYAYKKGTPSINTPKMSMEYADRVESNYDVYEMLTNLLLKGYFLDHILQPYNLDYGHFKILARLFNADKPLQKKDLTKRNYINISDERKDSVVRRTDHLIKVGMIEAHSISEKDESGKYNYLTVHTMSSKGIITYTEIVNTLIRYNGE